MVEISQSKMVDTYNSAEDEFDVTTVPSTVILPRDANAFQKAFWFKRLGLRDNKFRFKIGDEWR